MMHSAVLVLLLSLIASIYCVPTTVLLASENFQRSDCEKGICQENATDANTIKQITVHRWNHEKQDCESVKYSGCHPTENLFLFKERCLSIAKPICIQKQ